MVYISGGKVQESQTLWRLSIIPEIFWGIINFIVLFFETMISPSKTKYGNNYTSDYKAGNDGGGGGPRRRMGGFRGGGGGPASPPMGGG
ncbi:selenoprotein K-like [Mya arenaria]|uniref:selenoprotein K-like n=1 Tax=Mya arenaria TaxID=6604 RepID=UPI0022E4FC9D|nr:selenoprotein K-like [Mya arenaria]